MKELNTSLLREKFVIHDPQSTGSADKAPITALSNRIVLDLVNDRGENPETFVIRAQNMHSCLRMAARLIHAYNQTGKLLSRHTAFDWDECWEGVVNDYERVFNEQRWVAVYNGGRIVYDKGARHPFVDVIEKCDASNPKGDYDSSVPLAENAFRQTGKNVKIDYDGNVALAVHLERTQGRCGIILRGPNKTTTFNFSASAKKDGVLNYTQCLMAAAAFLEGIQMAFMIGMNEAKIQLGHIPRMSKQEKQTIEAKHRLTRLNTEISNLESAFDVNYRPERPLFDHIVVDAEKMAFKTLEPKKK